MHYGRSNRFVPSKNNASANTWEDGTYIGNT